MASSVVDFALPAVYGKGTADCPTADSSSGMGDCCVSRRPVIGIATQTLNAMPGQLPLCWVMSQRYVRVLAGLGAVPWLIPLLHDEAVLRATYERLDGLFLTGGVDVDPARYGEAVHERCGVLDPDRD